MERKLIYFSEIDKNWGFMTINVEQNAKFIAFMCLGAVLDFPASFTSKIIRQKIECVREQDKEYL